MYVVELIQPGVWLDGIVDSDEQRHTESLLRLLTSCIEDAAISVAMFEQAQSAAFSSFESVDTWEAVRKRESDIRAHLEAQLPLHLTIQERFAAQDEIREEARVDAKREAWASGQLPRSYLTRAPFILAKSCLYALDTIHKSLADLTSKPSAPSEVALALGRFESSFPDLREVRNSAHHVEDRVQGNRFGKPIPLQPVENAAISAPAGGVLIVDMLNNNRYGGTLADGSYGEIEVSSATLAAAGDVVQAVLNAYSWRGPALRLPM